MISTIIPCFKCANTVEATIQSILCQGVPSQIVAIDDGSPDDTLNVLNRFQDRAQILTGPNQGVSSARNKGIALIENDWVQFIDSDDLLAPNTWQARLELASKTDADVIVTDWAEFSEEAQINGSSLTMRSSDWNLLEEVGTEIACATRFWAPPAAVLYRRWVVDKIGSFRTDLPIIQDARFLFDAAHFGAKFAHVPQVGAYYRVADQSLSRSNPAKFWRDVLTNIQQIDALWQAGETPTEPARQALLEVYSSAANSLLRCGDPSFKQAESKVLQLGGNLGLKYRVGSHLASVFGPRMSAAAFQLGRDLLGARKQDPMPR